jgi:hypothetical protein
MTADDVRTLLRKEIEKAGTAKAWAAAHDVSVTLVSDTVNGRREPAQAIMKGLGLGRETIYYRAAQ